MPGLYTTVTHLVRVFLCSCVFFLVMCVLFGQMSLILPWSTHYLYFDRLLWPVTKRLDMNVELMILGLING